MALWELCLPLRGGGSRMRNENIEQIARGTRNVISQGSRGGPNTLRLPRKSTQLMR